VDIVLNDVLDDRYTRWVADPAGSSAAPGLRVGGYRLAGYHLRSADFPIHTRFEDPWSPPTVNYPQVHIELDLANAEFGGATKLLLPVLLAWLVTALSFALDPTRSELLVARLTTLGALMFTVVASMQWAGNQLGAKTGFTLIEKLYLAALGYVLAATVTAAACWYAFDRRDRPPERVRAIDRRAFLIMTVLSALSMLVLIGPVAWRSGAGR
jgi:hypothetical protein